MSIVIKNKRATFEYEIVDKYVAGIMLLGSEIKSVRAGKVSLAEAYCVFVAEELWVKNMHIAIYTEANRMNHETRRMRKLLLNKREMRKLHVKVKNRGMTIVPLKMFIGERGYAKLEIALVRGKKMHDKRSSIKERDIAREMDRSLQQARKGNY